MLYPINCVKLKSLGNRIWHRWLPLGALCALSSSLAESTPPGLLSSPHSSLLSSPRPSIQTSGFTGSVTTSFKYCILLLRVHPKLTAPHRLIWDLENMGTWGKGDIVSMIVVDLPHGIYFLSLKPSLCLPLSPRPYIVTDFWEVLSAG